jgi:hypothetical protein
MGRSAKPLIAIENLAFFTPWPASPGLHGSWQRLQRSKKEAVMVGQKGCKPRPGRLHQSSGRGLTP